MDLMQIEERLEAAIRGVPDANRTSVQVTRASSNPQTDLDKSINDHLNSVLRDIVDVPIMSEENPEKVLGRSGHCWIIDPIDGTINAIAGTDDFAICAALVDAKSLETLVAAVYLPRADRMFKAVRGKGASQNGNPLELERHRGAQRKQQKIAAFGVPSNGKAVAHRMGDALKNLFSSGWVTRQYGAASIEVCRVAAGSWSAFFEYGLMYWDFAAAALVATEAGCVVRAVPRPSHTADRIPLEYDLVVARTPRLLEEIIAAVGIRSVDMPG